MSHDKLSHIDHTQLAQKQQYQMQMILIPSKSVLYSSRPELNTEKYDTNFHTVGYLQNTNSLLNQINQIRGWHQNGDQLPYHLTKCKIDFEKLFPLLEFQFLNIKTFTSLNPFDYVHRVASQALLDSLTWTQLRDELKKPNLTNFFELSDKIHKLYTQMKTRVKCPKCTLRVKNLQKHLKTHNYSMTHLQSMTKYKELRQFNRRQYFREISETTYHYEDMQQLFR